MPNVFATNKTSSSITVAGHKVYYIDSTDAEIVEVQDVNNVKYNAFKYLLSGTPYWYVIDGEHDTWTDDLSAWGYSEVPSVVLPTVSVTGDWGSGNWLYVGVSAEYVYANASRLLYISPGGQQLLYDASKSYSPMRYTSSNGGSYKSPVEKFTISGNSGAPAKVVVNNITSSNLVLYSISVAVCSSNQATVVTVYNASNVAYNAFKFNANNTDYYYVLDGTQTDWTDDLAGIGYSLTPETVVAYLDSNKTAITMQSGDTTYLKDSSGYALYYDSTKTYSAYRYYSSSSDITGTDATGIRIGYLSGWSYLMIENNTGSTITIQRVEYTVS